MCSLQTAINIHMFFVSENILESMTDVNTLSILQGDETQAWLIGEYGLHK